MKYPQKQSQWKPVLSATYPEFREFRESLDEDIKLYRTNVPGNGSRVWAAERGYKTAIVRCKYCKSYHIYKGEDTECRECSKKRNLVPSTQVDRFLCAGHVRNGLVCGNKPTYVLVLQNVVRGVSKGSLYTLFYCPEHVRQKGTAHFKIHDRYPITGVKVTGSLSDYPIYGLWEVTK